MIEQFEKQLHEDLHQFLQSMKEIDARLPECPDVEEKWEQIAKSYIPDGIKVASNGGKWVLPKAGKVVYKDGAVDGAKLGDNPSGLKLTYKAKDGSFKGSFKVYAEVKGKPKATTVSVTGFLLNGIGCGTATIKKVGSVPIRVE